MTMYICNRCGDVVDESDLPTYQEDFGYDTELGHRSMYETFIDSCSCGGDYIEAEECCLCGGYFDPDKVYGGVCLDCLKAEATLDNAIEIGKENKQEVEINGFLASQFTAEQVDELLEKELRKAEELTNGEFNPAKQYCLEDESYFGEWLEEQTKLHLSPERK